VAAPLIIRTRRVLAAAAVALLSAAPAAAQPAVAADTLKAAFLYSFAKFTDWPPDSPQIGPFTFCVPGDPEVARALEQTVRTHTINGRPVAVSWTPSDLRACQVLYVTGLDRRQSQLTLDQLKGAPVLSVGDGDRFAELGGSVRLFVEGSKIRFEINLDASRRARLTISSRVLSLARIVQDEPADK
jgi:hypothetical protein